MKIDTPVLRIALPMPLRIIFDYLPLPGQTPEVLQPGVRIQVPFGRHTRVGYLIGVSEKTEMDPSRLKTILAVLDHASLLTPKDVKLLKWAASYYHHPLGEVMAAAFPNLLRTVRQAEITVEQELTLTEAGAVLPADSLPGHRRLRSLFASLKEAPFGLSASRLRAIDPRWRKTTSVLIQQGLAELRDSEKIVGGVRNAHGTPLDTMPSNPDAAHAATNPQSLSGSLPPAAAMDLKSPGPIPLNAAQTEALCAVSAAFGRYAAFLLDGVTGSGKTEVYLRLTEAALQRGEQVMVLVPEISLTPQLEKRFQERFGVPIGVFHSRLRETQRLAAWLRIQNGETRILLGTRSAVFVPMRQLGLIIIDEEHDPSFKQQEKFRFSARDVAIQKARYLGIPVLLGSATPSIESLWNVARGRFRALALPDRAGGAATPRFHLLDIRHQRLQQGLSSYLIDLIRRTLERREQVLLFLNRRGYAPTLICHDCGWVAPCSRCDARLVVHAGDACLRCHYCGHERPLPDTCPNCSGSELRPLGQGTERLEQTLGEIFPGQRVLRIDRDSTSRVGSLQQKLDRVHRGDVDILLGTQMLAKGHHFVRVTLVAIVDTDALLFSTDFRASERMSQLVVQVAGRAGRAERPGTVVLQTRHPNHPLLKTLITEGYGRFARAALTERRLARLPPASHMALWRADAHDQACALAFLQQLREHASQWAAETIALLGPAPAPMPRQAGRYRYQLGMLSPERKPLHDLVSQLERAIPGFTLARRVRWSIDIDPVECY